MPSMTKGVVKMDTCVLFLPGAAGDGNFWKGVGKCLPDSWEKRFLDWPGLGHQPPRPEIRGMEDLFDLAEKALQRPSAIVAQSMAGIIGIQLALRHPDRVTHLILTATSGGLNVARLGGRDWRPEYLAEYPETARWILTENPDLSDRVADLKIPTLLLWGEDDPVSPPAIGRYLVERIPKARLVTIPGGQHSLGTDKPEVIAPLIMEHVMASPGYGGHS